MHSATPGTSYAMGWGSMQRDWGGQVMSAAGSNGYWYAVVWAAPEQGFAILVVTNEAGDDAKRGTDEAAGALIRHYKATDAR